MRPNGFLSLRVSASTVAAVAAGAVFALGFFVGRQTAPPPVVETRTIEVAPEGATGPRDIGATSPGVRETTRLEEGAYTVQVGAFKKESDAMALKAALEKKGYKVSVHSGAGADKTGIYKVLTGRFKDKKSAEAVALKLRKSERLDAFITKL